MAVKSPMLFIISIILFFPIISSGEILKESVDQTEYVLQSLDFFPPELKGVLEDEEKTIFITVKWENRTRKSDLENVNILTNSSFVISTSIRNNVIRVFSKEICVVPGTTANFSVSIKGLFLGYSELSFHVRPFYSNCELRTDKDSELSKWNTNSNGTMTFVYNVSVIRRSSVLVIVITAVLAVLVVFNFINLGIQLDLNCIGKFLKKPTGPVIGFLCQFLFMPLASYGFGYLFLEDISQRLGLFILGCSPGGTMSNFWTLLFKGDVNLSITMTFVSILAALGMMPLWIFTLGRHLFRGTAVIPYLNLALSLLLLTVPAGVGLLIRQYRPSWAKISRKIIRPVTIVCVLFAIAVGIYANDFIFALFSWKVVAAGMCIAWSGYAFGAFFAWLAQLSRSEIIAVSIETAFQNAGVTFVMLTLSLPQPDADLSAVPVIAQLVITGLPMWTILICTSTYSYIRKKVNSKIEQDTKDVKVPNGDVLPNDGYLPVAKVSSTS